MSLIAVCSLDSEVDMPLLRVLPSGWVEWVVNRARRMQGMGQLAVFAFHGAHPGTLSHDPPWYAGHT